MRISDWSSDVCSSDLGRNELIGLGDVLAFDDLAFDLPGQPQLIQHLGRGQTIRRGFRVGDGQVLEAVALEHLALAVDITVLGRPQRQRADRLRSEERRGGKECVSTWRSRWSQSHT